MSKVYEYVPTTWATDALFRLSSIAAYSPANTPMTNRDRGRGGLDKEPTLTSETNPGIRLFNLTNFCTQVSLHA